MQVTAIVGTAALVAEEAAKHQAAFLIVAVTIKAIIIVTIDMIITIAIEIEIRIITVIRKK